MSESELGRHQPMVAVDVVAELVAAVDHNGRADPLPVSFLTG